MSGIARKQLVPSQYHLILLAQPPPCAILLPYMGPATATLTPVPRTLSTTRGTVAINLSSGSFDYNGVNLGWTANVKNNFN